MQDTQTNSSPHGPKKMIVYASVDGKETCYINFHFKPPSQGKFSAWKGLFEDYPTMENPPNTESYKKILSDSQRIGEQNET
jgi:hypothetical protein